jgi:hypothetical protein
MEMDWWEALSVTEAEALWALVQSQAQAEAVVRRLGGRVGWRYEGAYEYRRGARWVQGWQFVHQGPAAGLYLFELQRQARPPALCPRMVDATPRPAAPAAG